MIKILLVRPGSTDYDEQGRIKGRLDIPLNRRGADQVAQIVRDVAKYPVECVYCAPCRSALQTAEALGEGCGSRVKQVERLQNLDPGLWEGKLITEVKSQHPKIYRRWQEQPNTVCPPRGETLPTARLRVSEAVEKILKRHKQGVVALVVPEPLASVLGCQLKQQDPSDLWAAEQSCGHWELIDVEPAAAAAN